MSDDSNDDRAKILGINDSQVLIARKKGDADPEIYVAQRLKHGKPIAPLAPGGEFVKLTPREGEPGICNVEVLAHDGPARASTPAYRDGYEAVFGKKKASDFVN